MKANSTAGQDQLSDLQGGSCPHMLRELAFCSNKNMNYEFLTVMTSPKLNHLPQSKSLCVLRIVGKSFNIRVPITNM